MTFPNEDFNKTSNKSIREIMLAAAAAFVVFAGIVTVAQTVKVASAGDAAPAPVTAKADRVSTALPATCKSQAWGDWSADCLAAISGKAGPRQVRFETLEDRDVQARTSTLARVPVSS